MTLGEDAHLQAAMNSEPSVMVTSPGWQCPVCDAPGHVHHDVCFVKALADEAHRLRVANKRLAAINGRLRETAARLDSPSRAERWLTQIGVCAEQLHLRPIRAACFALADVLWRRR